MLSSTPKREPHGRKMSNGVQNRHEGGRTENIYHVPIHSIVQVPGRQKTTQQPPRKAPHVFAR
jgi:hypothetical protein